VNYLVVRWSLEIGFWYQTLGLTYAIIWWFSMLVVKNEHWTKSSKWWHLRTCLHFLYWPTPIRNIFNKFQFFKNKNVMKLRVSLKTEWRYLHHVFYQLIWYKRMACKFSIAIASLEDFPSDSVNALFEHVQHKNCELSTYVGDWWESSTDPILVWSILQSLYGKNSVHVLLIAHAVKTSRAITIDFKDLHMRYKESKRKRKKKKGRNIVIK